MEKPAKLVAMKKIILSLSVTGSLALGAAAYYLQTQSHSLRPQSSDHLSSTVDKHSLSSIDQASESNMTSADAGHAGKAEEVIIKPVRYGDYQSAYGALPKSLEGAPLPTGLSIDSDGHLIPTIALQRLFDFFLTTVGEEPLERVAERIEEYLDFQLDEPALSQAKVVFKNYQTMKNGIMAMESDWSEQIENGASRPGFSQIVARKREIRLAHLGEEVYDAFYQRDDQLDNYMLEKLAVLKDDSLSEDEQTQKLEEIEQLLPEAFQQKRTAEREQQQLQKDIEQAKAQGATETEIYQMRLEVMGAEKANRFQRADLAQRSWDERVSQYRIERNQILNSALSEQDKESQIQRLRETHFKGRELMRIPVIDRMKDQSQTLN